MCKHIILGALIALCAVFPVSAEVVYVTAENGLNIRQKPTEDSASTQVLDFGQRVVVIDDDPDLGGWYRVEGGGYVSAKHTQKTDPFSEMELLGDRDRILLRERILSADRIYDRLQLTAIWHGGVHRGCRFSDSRGPGSGVVGRSVVRLIFRRL